MKLSDIIKNIKIDHLSGNAETEVTGIQLDSRLIECNNMFVAIKGTQTDGHTYIEKAIEKGASVVVYETNIEETNPQVTYIKVANTEAIVGKLATTFYDNPTEKVDLIGVTGTNGKTTVATLLYKMFRHFGYKVGLLSTVCNYIDDEAIPTDHTTPDPITLNRLLSQMANAGCKYAFMEVSSHSIVQKRIGGLKFAGGIFTNITRDHLDYHKTFKNYIKAKKTFFDDLPKTAFALTNADDKNGLVMLQNTKAKTATYALHSMSDFKGTIIENEFYGMLMRINGREVNVQFIGEFNAYNLMAVYGTACLLGKQPEDILVALSLLLPVKGRFDAIRSTRGYTAIVDYAHTPDALANVLDTIQKILKERGKIITVVGAGGNRDKGKRPLMAQESVQRSDKVIITSDNPRFEKPQDIIDDMLAGIDKKDMQKVITIVDRKEAIRTACMFAQKGDVILVAGKGHENYQEIEGIKHHFDDKEILQDIFENE